MFIPYSRPTPIIYNVYYYGEINEKILFDFEEMGNPGHVDLDEAEYNKILQARNNLLMAISIEENYDLLISNYLDFENNLLEQATKLLIRNLSSDQDDRRLANKLLMNLLMSGKAYVDQNKHYISEIFGRDTDVYKNIENEFSTKKEQYLGYRVMEALRAHAQHGGWPNSQH